MDAGYVGYLEELIVNREWLEAAKNSKYRIFFSDGQLCGDFGMHKLSVIMCFPEWAKFFHFETGIDAIPPPSEPEFDDVRERRIEVTYRELTLGFLQFNLSKLIKVHSRITFH